MPFTDSMARNAKPAVKTVRMFDRDGLYLEVSPRGGKWWRLKYRYAGKEKRVSLGVYPEVNLKKARALGNCGQVFRYAIATGRAKRDPTGDLRGALPAVRPKHFAAITDPKRVGALMRAIDGTKDR